jgi:hypothetical protein
MALPLTHLPTHPSTLPATLSLTNVGRFVSSFFLIIVLETAGPVVYSGHYKRKNHKFKKQFRW